MAILPCAPTPTYESPFRQPCELSCSSPPTAPPPARPPLQLYLPPVATERYGAHPAEWLETWHRVLDDDIVPEFRQALPHIARNAAIHEDLAPLAVHPRSVDGLGDRHLEINDIHQRMEDSA